MSPLDLIAALTLGTAAAAVTAALVAGAERRVRPALLTVFAGWFATLVAAAAAGLFAENPALVGIAAAIPLVVAAAALSAFPALRAGLGAIPLPVLVAVHVFRLLGIYFVVLYAAGRLPAPFAPTAGWGDIAVAATAPFVAWTAWRRAAGWRPLVVAWNTVGLVDLLAAVGLGITSAPDTPFRLFFGAPDSGLMGTLPWVLIPTFLVPTFIVTHVATFLRLRRGAATTTRAATAGAGRVAASLP